MIIVCENCDKKFQINSNLIPKNGRLLECSSCNHQWFFMNQVQKKITPVFNPDNNIVITETNKPIQKKRILENKQVLNININDETIDKNNEIHSIYEEKKGKKKYNIFNLIIVFIISFVALIILLDTFKNPLSKIIPNIEFLLYNLYESIKDIKLFFNDLI
jgi:predicted Zn finger-like uncharacterized protein